MGLSSLKFALGLGALASFAAADDFPTCTSLNQRKAWSSLTDDEKDAYIEAEKCLMNAPTKLDVSGAQNRWDEIQNVHINNVAVIHSVGAFLPWHRLFTRAHEILLQTECNYTGAQPWWDEVPDADNEGNLTAASVFNPTTYFGGNGDAEDSCVRDGAFANLTLHLSYGDDDGDYCLSRDFDDSTFIYANGTYLDDCMAYENYTDFNDCMGFNPHRGAHGGIAGVMSSLANSPGDPLFFLHHAWIDRYFWKWQQEDLPARLYEMGGTNVPNNASLAFQGFDYPSSAILDYDGDPSNVTTLNHTLWMTGIIPNRTIAEVMNLTNSIICAEYIDP